MPTITCSVPNGWQGRQAAGLGDPNGIDVAPKLTSPVVSLARPEMFAEPVYLESEKTADEKSVD